MQNNAVPKPCRRAVFAAVIVAAALALAGCGGGADEGAAVETILSEAEIERIRRDEAEKTRRAIQEAKRDAEIQAIRIRAEHERELEAWKHKLRMQEEQARVLTPGEELQVKRACWLRVRELYPCIFPDYSDKFGLMSLEAARVHNDMLEECAETRQRTLQMCYREEGLQHNPITIDPALELIGQ